METGASVVGFHLFHHPVSLSFPTVLNCLPHVSSLSVPETARNFFPLPGPSPTISPHPLPGYSHSCLPRCPKEDKEHTTSVMPLSPHPCPGLSLPELNTTNASGRSVWGALTHPNPHTASPVQTHCLCSIAFCGSHRPLEEHKGPASFPDGRPDS